LDLHARLAALSYTNLTERAAVTRQAAARLGEVTRTGDRSEQAVPRYDATGYVHRQGLLTELRWMSFKDATAGLPALVDWLCEKHCLKLKYDVHSGRSFREDSEE
jgi:hypothetical protein